MRFLFIILYLVTAQSYAKDKALDVREKDKFISDYIVKIQDALLQPAGEIQPKSLSSFIEKELALLDGKKIIYLEKIFYLVCLYREYENINGLKALKTPKYFSEIDRIFKRDRIRFSVNLRRTENTLVSITEQLELYLEKKGRPDISELYWSSFLNLPSLYLYPYAQNEFWNRLIDALEEQGLPDKAYEKSREWSNLNISKEHRFRALYRSFFSINSNEAGLYSGIMKTTQSLGLDKDPIRWPLMRIHYALLTKDYKTCEELASSALADPKIRMAKNQEFVFTSRLKRCYVENNKLELAEKLMLADKVEAKPKNSSAIQLLRSDLILFISQKNFKKAFTSCVHFKDFMRKGSYFSFLKMYTTCRALQGETDTLPDSIVADFKNRLPILNQYAKRSKDIQVLLELNAEFDSKSVQAATLKKVEKQLQGDVLLSDISKFNQQTKIP